MEIEECNDGLDDIFDDMERMEYSASLAEESEHNEEVNDQIVLDDRDIIRSSWNVVGALNRLSEATIVTTAVSLVKHIKSIPTDYSEDFFNKCVIPALNEPGIISNSYLASLAAVIGLVDQACPQRYFGTLIIKYLMRELPEDRTQLKNTLILVSYMFFFDITSAKILVELLNLLLDKPISESTISSITILMTTCGQKLAHDVPGIYKQLNDSLETSVIKSVGSLDPQRVREAFSFKLVFLLEIFKSSSEKQVTPEFISVLNKNYREACHKMSTKYSGASSDPTVSSLGLKQLASFTVGDQVVKKEVRGKYNDDVLNKAHDIITSGVSFSDCAQALNQGSLLAGRKAHKVAMLIMSLLLEQKTYEPYLADLSAAIIGENPSTCRIAITAAVWDVFKTFDSLKAVPMTSFSRYLAALWLSGTVTWEVFRKAIPYLRAPSKKTSLSLCMTILLILKAQPNFGFVLASYKNDEARSLIGAFGSFIDILESSSSIKDKPMALCKVSDDEFEIMLSRFKQDLVASRLRQ